MDLQNHTPEVLWKSSEAFPEKPCDHEFGYVAGRKLVGCLREELIRCCGVKDIQLVWHPDAPRIVPAVQVPFLHEALLKRAKSRLTSNLWIGVLNLTMFGFMALMLAGSGRSISGYLMLIAAMGVLPVIISIRGLRALKRVQAGTTEPFEEMDHFSTWVGSRKVLFTWILLGAIIVVALLQLITGPEHSVQVAGLDKHAVWRGEWWRLFTGPMMHGGVYHLLFNASALVGLGRLMEILASRFHLALVFAISALSGSIFSLFLLPNAPSVGASGGLLGLIGFLCVLGIRRKAVLPAGFVKSIAINIAIIAAMGVLAYAMIDNAAHFGGLIAGLITGLLLVKRKDQTLPLQSGVALKITGALALAVTLGFAGLCCVLFITR